MNDIIIIGAGPAGISAAIYAKRAGYNVLVIEKDAPCNKLFNISKISNFPGSDVISGTDLALKFYNQLSDLKVEMVSDTVTKINKIGELFDVVCNNKTYQSKNVIIATGISYNSNDKFKKYIGKNVSTCVTCDGYFYKDKIVGYIGNDLEEIKYLEKICKKVFIGDQTTEIKGNFNVESIVINGIENKVDGLFVEKSLTNNSIIVPGLEYEKTFIRVDQNNETNIPGLYACGDVSNNNLKQIVTACYGGANAATNIIKKN